MLFKEKKPDDPRTNLLLSVLPEDEYNRLSTQLELLTLPLGKSLSESGGHMNCVFSPTTSIVSLLLLSLDRLPSNELVMTQELIANMLGVRREGVTVAAGKLHKTGLINYSRGYLTILDRSGLEARVCECYGVVKKEFARLLPEVFDA